MIHHDTSILDTSILVSVQMVNLFLKNGHISTSLDTSILETPLSIANRLDYQGFSGVNCGTQSAESPVCHLKMVVWWNQKKPDYHGISLNTPYLIPKPTVPSDSRSFLEQSTN